MSQAVGTVRYSPGMTAVPPDRSLRDDAFAIWCAGVAAVDAQRLVAGCITLTAETLTICGHLLRLNEIGRILVVGGGKAGAAMAAGLEQAVGASLLAGRISGWVNVPADCVRPLQSIHLHPARPAGVNEPTEEGVEGTRRILELVGELGPQDVCVVLLSGGGSALLPAPVEGITLADKQAITRGLMRSGATINELNCVRKQLSRIKGGRLANACRAGVTITLIISDVIGDPLDVIASGPTVPDESTPADALATLQKYEDRLSDLPGRVIRFLQSQVDADATAPTPTAKAKVWNHVIGNIGMAIDAAAQEADRRGYRIANLGGANAGVARDVGQELAEQSLQLRDEGNAPTCLLSGGEPVVHLSPTSELRRGGRNQELVLAAALRWWNEDASGLLLLSGGTDGEDGPTDAAGAVVDAKVLQAAHSLQLHPEDYLQNNNSYPFFEAAGGLLRTGPTHTNVMDLRVALVRVGG